MSILRQKLDVKPGLPENLQQQSKLWAPLHLELAARMSDILPRKYAPDGIKTEFDVLSELSKTLPDSGIYLGFGDQDTPSKCFASFSIEQAYAVTSHALDLLPGAAAEDYTPSRLDLLLYKPVIQAFEAEINALMSLAPTGSQATHNIDLEDPLLCDKQELNLKKLDIAFSAENWCCITFFIREQDNGAAGDAEKPKEKSKKDEAPKGRNRKNPEAQGRWSFNFVLPVNMLKRLGAAFESHQAQPVIDPSDPWTQHMRGAIDRAIVPVRAVVETCRMTVADCTRFEIGQVIKLPGVSLQSIGIETEFGEGKASFVPGALGIYKSHRAIKLTEDLDPTFAPEAGLV